MNRIGLSLWFLLLLVFIGATYFNFETGFLVQVWEVDASKLTFVIMWLFYVAYFRLGYLIYEESKYGIVTEEELDPGYEAADVSMALGMLGTVIGFILMTMSFVGVDFSNVENIKQLFALATDGMSTALYTTAAGLSSSIILRVTYYIFQRTL